MDDALDIHPDGEIDGANLESMDFETEPENSENLTENQNREIPDDLENELLNSPHQSPKISVLEVLDEDMEELEEKEELENDSFKILGLVVKPENPV
jgi:hypothetical protein